MSASPELAAPEANPRFIDTQALARIAFSDTRALEQRAQAARAAALNAMFAAGYARLRTMFRGSAAAPGYAAPVEAAARS